jgi:DNA-directed RNA polymerase sigma subunit (sigma70/sigma32)
LGDHNDPAYTPIVVTGQPGSGEAIAESARAPEIGGMVAGLPRPNSEEVARLLDDLDRRDGGPDPRQELVEGHLGLVLKEAYSRASETVPVEDLFQEGSAALVTVVHGLDPARPPSPAEFRRWVRQAAARVMDGLLEEEASARREEQRWAADVERLFNVETEVRLQSGTEPSDLELAGRLSWPVERVSQLRQAVAEARSQYDSELMDILGEIEDQ